MKMFRCVFLAASAALFALIVSSVSAAEPSAIPKRSVSMKMDAAHGLYLFQAEIERSQTATTAAIVLGELTEFVQSATGQDVESATMTKDKAANQYMVTVSIKAPAKGEEFAIAPAVPGLVGIGFVGNCPVNSHFEAQFADGEQLAKLTKEQRQQIEKAVVILAAFNHRLPWDAKPETVKPKAEIGKLWTIEAVFPKAAFEKEKPEVSLKAKALPAAAI